MANDTVFPSRIYRIFVCLVFGIIASNLIYLQVIKQKHFKDQSTENIQVKRRVRAPRGNILDRNGLVLADNVFRSSITLDRACLQQGQADSTLVRLMTWYGLDPVSTLVRLGHQHDSGRSRLVLIADASMAQIAVLEENRRDLPGVALDARPWRRYHYGPLFSHVIGYTGEATAEEVSRSREEYADFPVFLSGYTRGRDGIEAVKEDALRGQDGSVILAVDANGVEVGKNQQVTRVVKPGQDVKLTLSHKLQKALSIAMAGRVGCAVAMALPSGDILSAVSLPTFDTNLFTRGISSEDWQSLLGDDDHPLLNRTIQAMYPPGSPYKMVTSLCALENGVATTTTRLAPCYGGYRFGDRVFHCWNRNGHGQLDHSGAMIHSCDIFYYQVVQLLTLEQLRETAVALGFAHQTGVPFHGEAAGNIPDTQWYQDHYGSGHWSRGVLLNNAIGQGEILVTPLQMVVMTGRLATGNAILKANYIFDDSATPPAHEDLPFSAANLSWVRETMLRVVDVGTGYKAQVATVAVAGKTGTAQNPHGEDHAWFVCFAPASAPKVAFAVILENAGGGGSNAAPVAAQWLEVFFNVALESEEGS